MFGTTLAVGATTAGLYYLADRDAKRRRVFGLPKTAPGRRRLALAGVVTPGLLLAVFGNWDGFVVWLAAAPLIGWGIAAIDPHWLSARRSAMRARLAQANDVATERLQALESLRTTLAPHLQRLRAPSIAPSLQGARGAASPSKIEQLERRVAFLEQAAASRRKRRSPAGKPSSPKRRASALKTLRARRNRAAPERQTAAGESAAKQDASIAQRAVAVFLLTSPWRKRSSEG